MNNTKGNKKQQELKYAVLKIVTEYSLVVRDAIDSGQEDYIETLAHTNINAYADLFYNVIEQVLNPNRIPNAYVVKHGEVVREVALHLRAFMLREGYTRIVHDNKELFLLFARYMLNNSLEYASEKQKQYN